MNFQKVKPMMNRILVKKLEAPTKTAGGILLPENKNKNMRIGQIVEVGEGKHNAQGILVKPNLTVGQYVMLPEYGGVKLPKISKDSADEELTIFQEEDIIAVVELENKMI